MRCKKVQTSVETYLDGDLSQEEQARIERHLASCLKCRRELKYAERLHVLFAERGTPPVPGDFQSRLMMRARRQAEQEVETRKILHHFHWGLIPSPGLRMAMAAGMIAAMGIGFLIGTDLSDTEKIRQTSTDRVTEGSDYGLDYLAGTPEGSVPNAYVRLTSANQGE